jgi:3-hydroxyisobutyrate dehydrogenase-like beta-hydroxyacid dehydrogenase
MKTGVIGLGAMGAPMACNLHIPCHSGARRNPSADVAWVERSATRVCMVSLQFSMEGNT